MSSSMQPLLLQMPDLLTLRGASYFVSFLLLADLFNRCRLTFSSTISKKPSCLKIFSMLRTIATGMFFLTCFPHHQTAWSDYHQALSPERRSPPRQHLLLIPCVISIRAGAVPSHNGKQPTGSAGMQKEYIIC